MTTINTAIIGCDMSEDFFKTSASNRLENFRWKKFLVNNNAAQGIKKDFPEAEIVHDVEAIANDSDITLVLVSQKHIESIKPIIEAGKSVRIVS